jgi:hypothetical protein
MQDTFQNKESKISFKLGFNPNKLLNSKKIDFFQSIHECFCQIIFSRNSKHFIKHKSKISTITQNDISIDLFLPVAVIVFVAVEVTSVKS